MVAYVKDDLQFILDQILIAEAHAAGTPLTDLIPNPLLPWGLRTVDGSNNNIIPDRETWGAADELFPRLLPTELGDASPVAFDPDGPGGQIDGDPTSYTQTTGAVFDPQIRLASNSVVDQSLNNPAAILAALKYSGIEGAEAQSALEEIQAAVAAGSPAGVLAAYLAATGESEQAKAAAATAKASVGAIETLLAAATSNAATLAAVNGAITSATTVLTEAQALVLALSLPGVAPLDLAAAQQLTISAQSLVNTLTLLRDGPNPAGGNATNGLDAGAGIVIDDLRRYVDVVQAADALEALALSVDQQIDVAHATLSGGQLTVPQVLEKYGIEITESGSLVIPNIAPDEGISAPFNSWMTLFGQFFDHGLDLLTKGGSGTVFVPLQPDDPLYDHTPGARTNFMALTRATNQPGEDGVLGTEDDVHEHTNTTTPFVDQNQTYTSHASHQVFLREYATIADGADGNANPDIVATGRLLNGSSGGLPTWADVKAQAANVLGLRLHDGNIGDVPLLATDEYGRFLRGPNGFAQVVVRVVETDGVTTQTRDVLVEGVDTDGDTLAGLDLRSISASDLPASFVVTPGFAITGIKVVGTGHAFLDDIAHTANPNFSNGNLRTADSNATVGDHLNQLGDDEFPGIPGEQQFQMANREGPTRGGSSFYDNELLDRHFITGDGRGNENIGLTAVHHVFHSEHNRLMDHTKSVLVDTRDLDFIRQWVLPEFQNLVPTNPNDLNSETEELALINTLNTANAWNGERLFQAARFGTEMQYQHMVFEEFARKVNPMVDLFIFNPTMDINPAIFAEFAHVVYRFGHSMLNETVDRLAPNGQTADDIALFDAFLNPVEFDKDATVTADEAAGAIIRGMTQQRGNAIDEFVTDALRNNLVGLPLDLATLNMARARDTGVPSLNHAREEFYEMTKSEWLKPYVSWTDFAQSLKNPASIVNFIAAYGTHTSITSVATLEEKREAAELLVFGGAGEPLDRLDFLNGRNAFNKTEGLGGLDKVDLWLGGLAEEILPFGGMLGSTFTFVFEAQMQNLQNGDRFYYLSRTQGLHFITELENNSFASIVKKNTDLGQTIATDQVVPNADGTNGSSHLPGELFARNDMILEVNHNFQQDYNGTDPGKDPVHDDPVLQALQAKVFRVNDNSTATPNINPENHPDAIKVIDTARLLEQGVIDLAEAAAIELFLNQTSNPAGGFSNTYNNLLQVSGGEHTVLGGTEERDVLIGDLGDDTTWGDGGADLIIGGHGVNRLHGGAGDDIIYGGGDPEFIHGEDGNDVIHAGNGLGDLVFAGEGNDFVIAGEDGTEVFAGGGNDFVLGTVDVDFLLGGEGDDWLEGGEGFDTLAGENSQLFFNSSIIGHDVLFSGTNESDFDAESGDDIMVQGESVMRNEGMLGFDWVSFEEHTSFGADADMRIKIFTTVENDILRNRFDQVEAMSGSVFSDILIGDDRVVAIPDPAEPGLVTAENTLIGSELTRGGVNRIDGLQEVLGLTNGQVGGNQDLVAFQAGNILIGGDGNDIVQGGGGDDVIDGDKWLNVRIGIYNGNTQIGTAEKMQGAVNFYTAAEALALGTGHGAASAVQQALDGQQLDTLMFSRVVNGSQLRTVREILTDTTDNNAASATYNGDVDTAVFQGSIGEYTIRDANGVVISAPDAVIAPSAVLNLRGRITVEHTLGPVSGGGIFNDGTDTLENVERLQFSDATVELVPGLNDRPVGAPTLLAPVDPDGNPIVQAGLPLVLATNPDGSLAGVTDADNTSTLGVITDFTVTWQIEATPGAGDFADSGVTGLAFIPDPTLGLDGQRIRAVVTFMGENGVREVVITAATGPTDPATNLADTAADDVVVGTHAIPNNAANQAFVAAALAAGVTAAQLGFSLGQSGVNGTLAAPLDGGAGDDEIRGLSGNDFLEGDAGNDAINGGAGNDTAIFAAPQAVYDLSLNPDGTLAVNDNTNAAAPESDDLVNIETIVFTQGSDTTLNVAAVIAALNELALDPDTDPGALNVIATNNDDALADIAGVNLISGLNGDDLLFGLAGNDTMIGGGGNDILFGGAGTDTAQFDGNIANFVLQINAEGDLEVIDTVAGTEDALIGVENILFTGPAPDIILSVADVFAALNQLALNPATDPGEISPTATNGDNVLAGTPGADIIDALGGIDLVFGLGGNDTINAGAGDDEIYYNAGDGRDVVDGGTGTDIFDVTGAPGAETFRVIAVTDPANAALVATFGPLAAGTEILVTRQVGVGPELVIAELNNIEELVINTVTTPAGGGAAGGDNVVVVGDFTGTSLALATITINGSPGDDTVDITNLDSAHRIVFRSGGGDDVVVGTLRPQDVVELAPGLTPADYGPPVYANGTWTITQNGGGHSITYTGGPSMPPPSFVAGTAAPGTHPAIGDDFTFTANDVAELKKLVNGIPSANSEEPGSTGVRDLEGTGNNEAHANWGSADQPFIRLTEARYGEADANGVPTVNPIFAGLDPREISNIISTQEANLPKAESGANIFFMAFGQYVDHGLDFLAKGGTGQLAIGSGTDNPADLERGTIAGYDANGIPLHINKASPFVDQNQAYGSTELVGQFLRESDGNHGHGARLLSGGVDPSNTEFRLLPTLRELIQHHWDNDTVFSHATHLAASGGSVSFRTYYAGLVDGSGNIDAAIAAGLNADFMGSGHSLVGDANPFINVLDHYVAGDLRANENYTLTSIHTIWARNHNYHVDKLQAANFDGTDEELFQAAKIVNEAEYQKVVFGEFADHLLGGLRGSGHHGHDDYDPAADARISHEFAGAAYRFGHSLIGQTITVIDDNGQPKDVPLFDAFLNPTNATSSFQVPGTPLTGQAALDALAQNHYVPQEGFGQIGVNNIVKGIITQPAEEADFNLVDAVRDDLVRIRADLAAFNIARGWDLGLGTLNQVRAALNASTDPYVREAVELSGAALTPYGSWEDFQARNGLSNAVIGQFREAYADLVLTSDNITAFLQANPEMAPLLRDHPTIPGAKVLDGIHRVDLWVGGLAERHINDGVVGSTFWVILHEQLDRLQQGDRFYYTDRVEGFDFYAKLDEVDLAAIVARNTGLADLDSDVFQAAPVTQDDDDDASNDDGVSTGNDDDDTDPIPDVEDPGTGTDAPDTDQPGSSNVVIGNGVMLAGGAGDDVVLGTSANKVIDAGAGSDIVNTGNDSVVVLAGSGNDTVETGDGADIVLAGDDKDLVKTGSGGDKVWAGAGDDIAMTGAGDDMAWGEAGNDLLDTGAGDDLVFGDAGDDEINAGAGNDRIWGGSGGDVINAGDGDDRIEGGAGPDALFGGLGQDTFVFRTAEEVDGDRIGDFAPGDRIDLHFIDASQSAGGNNPFTLLNATAFTAEGQLIVHYNAGSNQTTVEGNTDAQLDDAEFHFVLDGNQVANLQQSGALVP